MPSKRLSSVWNWCMSRPRRMYLFCVSISLAKMSALYPSSPVNACRLPWKSTPICVRVLIILSYFLMCVCRSGCAMTG